MKTEFSAFATQMHLISLDFGLSLWDCIPTVCAHVCVRVQELRMHHKLLYCIAQISKRGHYPVLFASVV